MLKRYGFQIHPEKIRRLTPSQRQEITGLCVNSGKPTVSRKIRRMVRAMVHNMTKKQKVTEQELNRVKGLISFINQCPAHKSWCKDMMEKIKKIKEVVN